MNFRFLLTLMIGWHGAEAAPTSHHSACARELVGNAQYAQPSRGNTADLTAYRLAMDAVYLQKLALMVLLLPSSGIAVDMGSGSGRPTAVLAQLYPNVDFIGVDINESMVLAARNEFTAPNLFFKEGDIAQELFPPESVDVIINSSVLHHVTSFFGVGYRPDSAAMALANQVRALKMGGVLIVRDFVVPKGPHIVPLTLPKSDGLSEGSVLHLSTAALFRVFARDFRSSIHPLGFAPKVLNETADKITFEIDLRTAVEFLFHKDYREHWEPEIKEEYTYFSQKQFESLFRLLNLRTITSRPIFNPWIIENRLKGKYEMPVPYPPTNIFIVGEKVPPGRPIELFEQTSRPLSAPRFLQIKNYQNSESEQVFSVAERPNPTIDILPYQIVNGQVFVMSRKSYPRPILTARLPIPHLTDSHLSGYIVEPVSLMLRTGEHPEQRAIEEFARHESLRLKNLFPGSHYYPSAGFLRERVTPFLAEVEARLDKDILLPATGGLTDMGTLHWTEASQALRAYQVGGAFDSRFEINIYRLFRKIQKTVGPWIGGDIRLRPQKQNKFAVQDFAKSQPFTQTWRPTLQRSDYIEVRGGQFAEIAATDSELGHIHLEYLLPQHVSHHTVTLLPVANNNGEILVGLEAQDLPVPQSYGESSTLWTTPGFRIPKDVRNIDGATSWAKKRLLETFEVQIGEPIGLGSDYRVSPGTTPEIVYPYTAEVDLQKSGPGKLHWFRLKDLLKNDDQIHSAHLLTSLFRVAHALGLLE